MNPLSPLDDLIECYNHLSSLGDGLRGMSLGSDRWEM